MEPRNLGLDFQTRVARKVSSVSEMPFLIDQIMRMAEKVLKASASSVLLIDRNQQEMFFEFADGPVGGLLKEVKFSIQSGIAGWVARTGEAAIVNDVENDKRFYNNIDRMTGYTTRSILCTPLKVRGRVIGVLEVLNKRDGSDFTERDLEVLEAVAATTAITIALKQAEDALRASEEHYSALVANLTDGVLHFTDGVVTWCNDKVEAIFGYPKKEILGKNASFFFPREITPLELTKGFSNLDQQRLLRRVTTAQRKDGSLIDVEYSISQIPDRDQIEIVALARDLSQQDNGNGGRGATGHPVHLPGP